jgi:hypothetical protein
MTEEVLLVQTYYKPTLLYLFLFIKKMTYSALGQCDLARQATLGQGEFTKCVVHEPRVHSELLGEQPF